MPSPLPFVHLFVSRIKAPLPFHLLAYSYLARSATKPISLQRTPPDDSPRVARLGSPLSALGTLSTNSTSKIVESRSEEEPVRTSSTRRPIDCACMRASRERGPLSRCDRDRARRFSSSFFLSFFFFIFPSSLLHSSPYPEYPRREASGTGRCEIAINRFDELAAIHLSTSSRPTYLPTYHFSLPSTRLITTFSLPNIAN